MHAGSSGVVQLAVSRGASRAARAMCRFWLLPLESASYLQEFADSPDEEAEEQHACSIGGKPVRMTSSPTAHSVSLPLRARDSQQARAQCHPMLLDAQSQGMQHAGSARWHAADGGIAL